MEKENESFEANDGDAILQHTYNVGDTVLLVLSGESKPVGGIIKEIRSYGEVILTVDGIDWNITPGFIVRSAVTSPAALKDALASINPSKSLGKSEKKAFDGSESLPSK